MRPFAPFGGNVCYNILLRLCLKQRVGPLFCTQKNWKLKRQVPGNYPPSSGFRSIHSSTGSSPPESIINPSHASDDGLITSSVVRVQHLPPRTTQADVRRVFSNFGEIKSVWLTTRSLFDETNNFIGRASVEFESAEVALRVVESHNTKSTLYLNGRELEMRVLMARLIRNPPSRTLFVGKIPAAFSTLDAKKLFEPISDVKGVTIAQTSGVRYGLRAYIHFSSEADARKVLEKHWELPFTNRGNVLFMVFNPRPYVAGARGQPTFAQKQ